MDRKMHKLLLDWFCLALILASFFMVGCVVLGYVSLH
jgi:hypothetical protein